MVGSLNLLDPNLVRCLDGFSVFYSTMLSLDFICSAGLGDAQEFWASWLWLQLRDWGWKNACLDSPFWGYLQ